MARLLFIVLIGSLGYQPSDARDIGPLANFDARVEAYAALRRDVAERVRLRLEPTSDPQTIGNACDALAAGIVRARSTARVGDLFIPSIVGVFKERIARVATPDAVRIWYHQLYSAGQRPPRQRVGVHARLPGDEFSPVVPIDVLRVLPVLPPELTYRLAGRDLLLVDADAALVIDLLPEALPRPLLP